MGAVPSRQLMPSCTKYPPYSLLLLNIFRLDTYQLSKYDIIAMALNVVPQWLF